MYGAEVFGAYNPDDDYIILGNPSSSTVYEDSIPANAIDGNYETRYNSNSNGFDWWSAEFKQGLKAVTRVRLQYRTTDGPLAPFK